MNKKISIDEAEYERLKKLDNLPEKSLKLAKEAFFKMRLSIQNARRKLQDDRFNK